MKNYKKVIGNLFRYFLLKILGNIEFLGNRNIIKKFTYNLHVEYLFDHVELWHQHQYLNQDSVGQQLNRML